MHRSFTLTIIVSLCFLAINSIAQTISPVSHRGHSSPWQVEAGLFEETFNVTSSIRGLQIEVYDLEAHKSLTTLFRHYNADHVVYQTGLELDRGVYLLRVTDGDLTQTYKLIKHQE